MMKPALVRRLDPHVPGTRTDSKIPVREYVEIVRSLLPNLPRDVAIQWLYRHYESFIDDYVWLDFDRLMFGLEKWSTDRILSKITSRDDELVEAHAAALFAEPDLTILQRSMLRRGTWPRPVLVLDNRSIRRRVAKFLGRYHLLEGHRRLGNLRALARRDLAQPEHSVWFVKWRASPAG